MASYQAKRLSLAGRVYPPRAAPVAWIRTPLKELASELEDAGFWQIHRGYVVAVKRIAAVSRDADGALWLSLRDHKDKLPVSQRFQHRFKGM